MKNLIIRLAALLIFLPFSTTAHPGHGHENPLSPGHYVLNPEHSIPILLTLAALTFFVIWQRRQAHSKK